MFWINLDFIKSFIILSFFLLIGFLFIICKDISFNFMLVFIDLFIIVVSGGLVIKLMVRVFFC